MLHARRPTLTSGKAPGKAICSHAVEDAASTGSATPDPRSPSHAFRTSLALPWHTKAADEALQAKSSALRSARVRYASGKHAPLCQNVASSPSTTAPAASAALVVKTGLLGATHVSGCPASVHPRANCKRATKRRKRRQANTASAAECILIRKSLSVRKRDGCRTHCADTDKVSGACKRTWDEGACAERVRPARVCDTAWVEQPRGSRTRKEQPRAHGPFRRIPQARAVPRQPCPGNRSARRGPWRLCVLSHRPPQRRPFQRPTVQSQVHRGEPSGREPQRSGALCCHVRRLGSEQRKTGRSGCRQGNGHDKVQARWLGLSGNALRPELQPVRPIPQRLFWEAGSSSSAAAEKGC